MPLPDYTTEFNTQLDPRQEDYFQMWLRSQSKLMKRNIANDMYDYDLRGWWLKNHAKTDRLGPALTGGHLTDQWKKPNHPTFSEESMYSNTEHPGGKWQEVGGKWSYTPSAEMLSGPYTYKEMQDYFSKYEPAATLNNPSQQRGYIKMQPDARQQAMLEQMRREAAQAGHGFDYPQQYSSAYGNRDEANSASLAGGVDPSVIDQSKRYGNMRGNMHDEFLRAQQQKHYQDLLARLARRKAYEEWMKQQQEQSSGRYGTPSYMPTNGMGGILAG